MLNLKLALAWLYKYLQTMFFDSLLRRKQGVFTPTAPSINSMSTSRQAFIIDPFNRVEVGPRTEDKKMIINRSKSSKQLVKNGLNGHTKHPILQKQRNCRQIQNVNIQQSTDPDPRALQGLAQSRDQKCDRHGRNYQNWKSSEKYADFHDYEFKNLPQLPTYYQLKDQRNMIENSANYMSLPPNYLRQAATGNQFHKIQMQSFSVPSNHLVRRKSSHEVQILSPFSMDEHQQQCLEEETTKMSQAGCENRLMTAVRQLQKQIEELKEDSDKDKINIGNLKQENDRLKKGTLRSKQNLDLKLKDRGEVIQLKRLVKQERENTENVQKQRQAVLKQLNQTLIAYQSQKLKWQKEKKQMHMKNEALISEGKDQRNQNIMLSDKVNLICMENKKLRQKRQYLEKQAYENQKELAWMNSKVNDLKQALEHLKIDGNSRIEKLQVELRQVEKKRKQQKSDDFKKLQNKVAGQQVILRERDKQIQQLLIKAKDYQLKIQVLEKQLLENRNLIEQLQSAKREIKRVQSELNSYQNSQKLLKDKINSLNMTIESTNKQSLKLKEDKQILEQANKETKDKLSNFGQKLSMMTLELAGKNREIENLKVSVSEQNDKNRTLAKQMQIQSSKLREMQANNQKLMLKQKDYQKKSEDQVSKIVYTQLQMRLCSILGIYLTTNVEKIIAPIEEMVRSRRGLEANSKNYQELLRLFQVKEGPSRLISMMQQCKNNYQNIVGYNLQIQSQNVRLKEENSFLIGKFEQANHLSKKLQPIVESSNQSIMRLRLQLQNAKYSPAGVRKW